MKLVTLMDGRTGRIEGDSFVALPGNLVDHLCRPISEPMGPPAPFEPTSLGPPIPRPGKIVCVGLNYLAHAKEGGVEPPARPLLFSKFSSAVIGPGQAVVRPAGATQLDFEAELAVVIGRPARGLEPSEALSVVGGYACLNDISEREAQLGDGQWLRGKTADTFAPFGPYVATPDEIPDPQELGIRTIVNGELRQDSRTADMIFSVAEIISFCSKSFTLDPGDVIATGTPEGVGLRDGRYLEPGDVVTVEIDGLGSLTNHVIDEVIGPN